MLSPFSAPSRRRVLLWAGVVVGALCLTSPVPAGYTLDMTIKDNMGHSFTTPVTGPFTAGGVNSFTDIASHFPEFSFLSITAAASQGASSSFLNSTAISGTLMKGTKGLNLTITVFGNGFTSPAGVVEAFNSLASSTTGGSGKPAAFSSGSIAAEFFAPALVGAVPTMTLGPPPFSADSPTVSGIDLGHAGYNVEQIMTITGLNDGNSLSGGSFNITGTTNWLAPHVVPAPPALVTLLLGVATCLGLAWVRRRRPAAA
jgi:hypothetical protein